MISELKVALKAALFTLLTHMACRGRVKTVKDVAAEKDEIDVESSYLVKYRGERSFRIAHRLGPPLNRMLVACRHVL